MRKYYKMIFFVSLVFLVITCKKREDAKKETILEGTATIVVDETLTPIIEDEVQIFENQYNAKINIKSKSEAEAIQELVKDNKQIAILARPLSKEEANFFASKKIIPKITPFAKDAIALIVNKSNND